MIFVLVYISWHLLSDKKKKGKEAEKCRVQFNSNSISGENQHRIIDNLQKISRQNCLNIVQNENFKNWSKDSLKQSAISGCFLTKNIEGKSKLSSQFQR